jgi:DNA-binding transcriptional LysR family regulator
MLELRRLKVLREVARQGSFSAAASSLNFTPSAISQQIAQLEREVGVQLVERSTTGVELTRAGQVLLAHANAMLARAADAEAELRELATGNWGRLRVGAFASAASSLMPAAIVAYRGIEPRVAVELVEQDRDDSIADLQRGELDLAIVVLNGLEENDGNWAGADIEVTPLLDDYIDLLLPSDHRLASAETVALEDLRDEAWIDCSGTPVRFWLTASGIKPNIVFNSDHHYVVHALVAAGLAVAFSPRLTQPVVEPGLVVKPIAPDPPVRRVGIAFRAESGSSQAIRSLADVLLELAQVRVDGHGVDREAG